MSDATMPTKAFFYWSPSIGGGPGQEEGCGVIRAATAGKARYSAWLSAKDAFQDMKITEIRVRRAPEFDRLHFRDCSMPRYARLDDASYREKLRDATTEQGESNE